MEKKNEGEGNIGKRVGEGEGRQVAFQVPAVKKPTLRDQFVNSFQPSAL